MNTQIVFAARTYTIPTPKHANQTPQEIQAAFVKLLSESRAALLAIKQAAAGECVLVINPSRNPHANQVFAAVLGRMVQTHQIVAARNAEEALAAKAPVAANMPTANDDGNGEPPQMNVIEMNDDAAEMEAAFAL
jgi:hypothetical protein